MAIILSIETSTSVCSVAIHNSGELIALAEINEVGAHAEKLMGLISEVLKNANLDYKSMDAIAVSEGPGSYTGLRIGVSTAKGLAYGLDKPLIGINTLQALATSVQAKEGEWIVAVLDARRMEVFSQTFDFKFEPASQIESIILEETAFQNLLESSRVYFVGDALEKMKDVVKSPNAVFLNQTSFSASNMGKLAFEKFSQKRFEDIAYFVPNYLKEFKALQSKKNPLLSL
ncbi:tRNA threonylcarbamoyladenosine biosynthesis protein TsaB [Algoriphagus boseongensis]|uniref:tRNA threonylcarbamoyladenosine biosynthesis protein TsaB n=1 Tax=Algoriphagus boseongensis TaxID=1442587 RepID=A0A4R6T8S2_9BACT|nr:tRNA (adenosine(37)-N6)-threonylcarbamoyltransferase complex dimerization subunit type 1 TsaB [Algoriphagus boseongensis]TDQ17665.1 tRNA threonylcarbamoyladenosine biosynthesis protein TsaB [Algoriphagus boseongensis]